MKVVINNRNVELSTNRLTYIHLLHLCGVDVSNKTPLITYVAWLDKKVISGIVEKNTDFILTDGMVISSLG